MKMHAILSILLACLFFPPLGYSLNHNAILIEVAADAGIKISSEADLANLSTQKLNKIKKVLESSGGTLKTSKSTYGGDAVDKLQKRLAEISDQKKLQKKAASTPAPAPLPPISSEECGILLDGYLRAKHGLGDAGTCTMSAANYDTLLGSLKGMKADELGVKGCEAHFPELAKHFRNTYNGGKGGLATALEKEMADAGMTDRQKEMYRKYKNGGGKVDAQKYKQLDDARREKEIVAAKLDKEQRDRYIQYRDKGGDKQNAEEYKQLDQARDQKALNDTYKRLGFNEADKKAHLDYNAKYPNSKLTPEEFKKVQDWKNNDYDKFMRWKSRNDAKQGPDAWEKDVYNTYASGSNARNFGNTKAGVSPTTRQNEWQKYQAEFNAQKANPTPPIPLTESGKLQHQAMTPAAFNRFSNMKPEQFQQINELMGRTPTSNSSLKWVGTNLSPAQAKQYPGLAQFLQGEHGAAWRTYQGSSTNANAMFLFEVARPMAARDPQLALDLQKLGIIGPYSISSITSF